MSIPGSKQWISTVSAFERSVRRDLCAARRFVLVANPAHVEIDTATPAAAGVMI